MTNAIQISNLDFDVLFTCSNMILNVNDHRDQLAFDLATCPREATDYQKKTEKDENFPMARRVGATRQAVWSRWIGLWLLLVVPIHIGDKFVKR